MRHGLPYWSLVKWGNGVVHPHVVRPWHAVLDESDVLVVLQAGHVLGLEVVRHVDVAAQKEVETLRGIRNRLDDRAAVLDLGLVPVIGIRFELPLDAGGPVGQHVGGRAKRVVVVPVVSAVVSGGRVRLDRRSTHYGHDVDRDHLEGEGIRLLETDHDRRIVSGNHLVGVLDAHEPGDDVGVALAGDTAIPACLDVLGRER